MTEKELLGLIRKGESQTDIDRTTAYRDLTGLVKKGIVYREGKARATKYLLKYMVLPIFWTIFGAK